MWWQVLRNWQFVKLALERRTEVKQLLDALRMGRGSFFLTAYGRKLRVDVTEVKP